MESQLEVYDLQMPGSYKEKIEIHPSVNDLLMPGSYKEKIEIQSSIEEFRKQLKIENEELRKQLKIEIEEVQKRWETVRQLLLRRQMEIQREAHDFSTQRSNMKDIEIQPVAHDLSTPRSYMEEIKIQPVIEELKKQTKIGGFYVFTTGSYISYREGMEIQAAIKDRKSRIKMESIPDSFSSLLIPKESRSPREIMDRKNQMKMEDIDDDKSGMSLTLNEEIAFEKQQRFDQNHYPSHGTNFLRRTLSLFIVFLQCAGGTVLANSQQERQALSDIYQSTLAEVSNCPTRSDFDERSYNRCANVCDFHMQEGCAYHCMRDSSKTRLVEFCAKPKILFTYCPEYDPVDQTIQKDEDTLCNYTSNTIVFLSSNIFVCDPNSCFQINERTVRTDATTLTTLTIKPFVRNSGKIQQTLCTGLLVFVVMTMYM